MDRFTHAGLRWLLHCAWILRVLLIAVVSGCNGNGGSAVTPSPADVPHLGIEGPNIVDASGSSLTLRGWNWGRWGLTQPNDAADNASQGADVVRIPLRWWGYYEGNDIDSRDDSQTATAGIDAGHLAILDAMVAQASAAHLWIILFIDSNCGQDGTQSPQEVAYCDPGGSYPNGHNFWTDADERAKFIAVWQFISARYRDTPYLGVFEVLPEPNPPGVADSEITSFYDQVMTAIRPVAPGVPFIVGPRSYDLNQVSSAFDPSWQDVIYTGDLFLHTGGTQEQNITDLSTRLQNLVNLQSTASVPVFVQQAGVQSGDDPNLVYLNAMLALLNSSRVGYTYWDYRDDTNADGYGVIYQDGNGGWITKTDFLDTITSGFSGDSAVPAEDLTGP